MYELSFTETDLYANRQGYLSEAQQERLRADTNFLKKQTRQTFMFFMIGIPILMFVGLAIEYNNSDGNLEAFLSPQNQLAFAIICALFATIFLIGYVFSWWTIRRLEKSQIRQVENIVKVINKTISQSGRTYPLYNIEFKTGAFSKITFRFSTADSLAYFEDGKRYRIYYLEYTSPQALSAEPID